MREVGVLEAKTHLSALLEAVEKGGEAVLITRNGRPVAKLLPAQEAIAPPPRRLPGKELVERFKKLQDEMAAANPGIENMTWEELKQMARE
ncbi:type II toxin-antitoxin system Phd/YefM family antitoxin [Caulobacter endophyticus]|uniref:Antitoxin n=1 Tax=Caulobacter endophyticus TaxID=2172652 RepID=A0A2T9JEC4_9CAUL|nr:type II toxin-antitoxin system Phd/YefM family antitoxin [Caulobacter endophyticus]PVM82017.1 type II toxin-antitoxin system prevent-host-death family antitoxin [Caulobacter endophyticus]